MEVYNLSAEHSCICCGRPSRSVVNSLKVGVTYSNIIVILETNFQAIMDCLGLMYHETIHYQATCKARNALPKNILKIHREAFHKLPQYVKQLSQSNRQGHFYLGLNNDQFSRIFVCPAYGKPCFSQFRRICGVDGTFLTVKFVLTYVVRMAYTQLNCFPPTACSAARAGIGLLNILVWLSGFGFELREKEFAGRFQRTTGFFYCLESKSVICYILSHLR